LLLFIWLSITFLMLSIDVYWFSNFFKNIIILLDMFFGPRTAMTCSLFCWIVIMFLLWYLCLFLLLACLCVCMTVLFFTSLFVDLCSRCDVLCSFHCMTTELATQAMCYWLMCLL
jgi:hypothetical protein